MSNEVIDACSIINLINGDVLEVILNLPNNKFFTGTIVFEECCKVEEQKKILEIMVNANKLEIIEEDVEVNSFIRLKQAYNLGNGETESIAHCLKFGYNISSDDLKARASATQELGQSKVFGSLYFLREAVRNNLLSCDDAKAAFVFMKVRGGYLPNIDIEYFCT